MARFARTVVLGVAHHVSLRGNRRQPVFFEQADYAAYVELASAASAGRGGGVWRGA